MTTAADYVYYTFNQYQYSESPGNAVVDRFNAYNIKKYFLGKNNAWYNKIKKLRSDTISLAKSSDSDAFAEIVEAFLDPDSLLSSEFESAYDTSGATVDKTITRYVQDDLDISSVSTAMAEDLTSVVQSFMNGLRSKIESCQSEIDMGYEAYCEESLKRYAATKELPPDTPATKVAMSYINDMLKHEGLVKMNESGSENSTKNSLAKIAALVESLEIIEGDGGFDKTYDGKTLNYSTKENKGKLKGSKEILQKLFQKIQGSYSNIVGKAGEIATMKAYEVLMNKFGMANSEMVTTYLNKTSTSILLPVDGTGIGCNIYVSGDSTKKAVMSSGKSFNRISKPDVMMTISDGKVSISFGTSVKSLQIGARGSKSKTHSIKLSDSMNFYELLNKYVGGDEASMKYAYNVAAARADREIENVAKSNLGNNWKPSKSTVNIKDLNQRWSDIYESVVAGSMLSIIAGGVGDNSADTALYLSINNQIYPMEDVFASLLNDNGESNYSTMMTKKGTRKQFHLRKNIYVGNSWVGEEKNWENAKKRSENIGIVNLFNDIKITVSLKDIASLVAK